MCKNYTSNIIKILSVVLILLLANCEWFRVADTAFLAGTNIKIPEGTPIFKKGFKDGCETVLNSRGNSFYRTRYDGFKYSPQYIDNAEYKFAVSRGYGYCFNYVIRYLGEGSDAFIVSPSNFNWGLGSINETNDSKGQGAGFGLDQSAIDQNIFSDIFWWTKTKDGKGGGAMSENVFYGTSHNYFGSFGLPDGSFGHTDSGISNNAFGDYSPFGGPYSPFGN
jgi:hypothetical protein